MPLPSKHHAVARSSAPCDGQHRSIGWRLAALAVLAMLGTTACHGGNSRASTASTAAVLQRIDAEARAHALPGYAVVLFDRSGVVAEHHGGAANLAAGTAVDAGTLFPLASLTKTWSAVVVLQLVEEGALRLDQPVIELLPDVRLPHAVQVRHLLSHTSQGTPGRHFHYDGRRYGLLGRIIEVTSGESFAQALERRIIAPLQLRDTFLLGATATATPRLASIATPYRDPGGLDGPTPCDPEYGYSASAGLVSTARDVAAFEQALLAGELLAPAQLALIVTPFLPDGPSGLGSFVQTVDGRRLVWAYGQYDCHAALTLFDPERRSGVVFLANTSTPADAARLLYGDVTASPIALAWLGVPEDAMLHERAALVRDAFFAQAQPARLDAAIAAADRFLERHPEQRWTPDLVVAHALATLGSTAMRTRQQRPVRFDAAIEAKTMAVLAADGGNPYAHYYLASTYATQGRHAQARAHFQAIVSAPNAARNWYTREAEAALSAGAAD